MKTGIQRLLLIIALLLWIIEVSSQTIVVKSFRKIESDQEARISSPKTDQNGKKCAIIKVVTSQTGFVFDFGLIGNALATEQKTGEIWVWVPAGARKVTISHQQLGVLRNYPFDIDIEEAMVYEMVLTTGKVEITVKEEQISSQWLVINSTPSGADIYIDDQPANQTPYQNELPLGKHTYRLSRDMYLPTAGSIVLTADKKETINPVLKPDFGTLNITTSPEGGAAVSIDGVDTGKNTPCTLSQLKSGEHSVTLRLNMYKRATEKINIQPEGNHNLPVTLTPTFAEVIVNTNPASDIYIAGEQRGSGTWSGRLLPGIYLFEAKKYKYTSVNEKHEIITGQPLNLILKPIAKTGMLKVLTTPTDATIILNGENKGTTPVTLRDLLVGDYPLTLSLPNYATISQSITIIEGQTTEVKDTLSSGTNITIKGYPTDAQLYVDNQLVGNTPYIASLSFGIHTLRLQKGNEKTEKSIEVKHGGIQDFSLELNANFIETASGLNLEMVFVNGGTFEMGSNEKEDYADPVHSVTLSNFYIGKYEITQAQWKTIMGNNPSGFKGDNLPVSLVSWNDIQEFIRKLNVRSGKNYRLPTEAEWEYAARGGTESKGFKFSGSNREDDVSWNNLNWYKGNNDLSIKIHSVGSKQPNELGIYDMSGNVWEWCNDGYGSYSGEAQTNPTGPSSGEVRVSRGGSFTGFGASVMYHGLHFSENVTREDLGFRLSFSN